MIQKMQFSSFRMTANNNKPYIVLECIFPKNKIFKLIFLMLGQLVNANAMGQEKQKPQQFLADSSPINIRKQSTQAVKSEFAEQYQKQMKHFFDKVNRISVLQLQELEKESIKLLKNQFVKKFTIKIKFCSVSTQIITFNARWGFFQIDIDVLNILGNSKTHSLQNQYPQSITSIYRAGLFDKRFTIKCIKIKKPIQRTLAIKEWFLLKLGSTLKFGPHIERYLGFDLIMHEECIEFAMESCADISQQNLSKQVLYCNLARMHTFRIIHADIKPSNIMFSSFHQKLVFIDFGLSRIVQEETNCKTLTSFVGSLNFCTDQMGKCFIDNKSLFIDLYYNDLNCLQKSISSLHKNMLFDEMDTEITQIKVQVYKFLLLILSKYLLFGKLSQSPFIYIEILQSYPQCITQLLNFLRQFSPNKVSRTFFEKFVPERQVQTILYNQIKYVYQNGNENSSCITFQPDQSKSQAFLSFYANLQQQLNVEKSDNSRAQALRELLFNLPLIQKLNFHTYVKSFLQFTCYFNNKYGATAQQRQKAAQNFCLLCQEDQQWRQLKGYMLLALAVEHIIKRYLYESQIEKMQADETLLLFLKLYNFMVILECGSIDEFLRWLNDMFCCPKLNLYHKWILLKQVDQSLRFCHKRTLPRKGEARGLFLDSLQNWVTKGKRVITNQYVLSFDKKTAQHVLYEKIKGGQKKVQLSQQLLNELNLSVLQFCQFAKHKHVTFIVREYQELYFKIKNKLKHQPFCFFHIKLYNFYTQAVTLQLAQGIYKIIAKNISDEDILKEHLFQFEMNSFIPFLVSRSQRQYLNGQRKVRSYFETMKQPQLRENILFLNRLFNKLIIKNRQSINKLDYSFQIPFQEHYRLIIQHIPEYLLKQLACKLEQLHFCLNLRDVTDCVQLYRIFMPQKITQVCSKFDQALKSGVSCSRCRNLLQINLHFKEMQDCVLMGYSKYVNKKNLDGDQARVISQAAKKILKLLQPIQKQKQLPCLAIFKLKQSVFYNFQLFCCISDDLQKRYQGILQYFRFTHQNSTLVYYFVHSLQYNVSLLHIYKTLQTLYPEQYILFLIKITETLHSKSYVCYYSVIVESFNYYIKNHSEERIIEIFQKLKQYQFRTQTNYPYISIILCVLLRRIHRNQIQSAIIFQILKTIQLLNIFIKRYTITFLYLYQYGRTSQPSQSRKFDYLTKRLLALFINTQGNQHFLQKAYKVYQCNKKSKLYHNLRKFGQCRVEKGIVKLSLKQS